VLDLAKDAGQGAERLDRPSAYNGRMPEVKAYTLGRFEPLGRLKHFSSADLLHRLRLESALPKPANGRSDDVDVGLWPSPLGPPYRCPESQDLGWKRQHHAVLNANQGGTLLLGLLVQRCAAPAPLAKAVSTHWPQPFLDW